MKVLSTLLLSSFLLASPALAQDICQAEQCVKRTVIVKKEVIKPTVNLTLKPSDVAVQVTQAEQCRPGRTVGASLGVVASFASMAVGAGFLTRGIQKDTTSDPANLAVGIGASVVGVGGFIPSVIALVRDRRFRKDTGCAPGHFRSSK